MKYVFLIGLFFVSACASQPKNDYCKGEGRDTPDCEQVNHPNLGRK
jgi:hypothetical protein